MLEEARSRSLALLKNASDRLAGNIAIHWAYANALKDAGKTDEAIKAYDKVRSVTADAPALFVLGEQNQRRAAGLAEVELRLAAAQEIENTAQRAAATDRAAAILEQVESTLPQAARHLLRGKLAVVRRNWDQAIISFDRACEATNNRAVDALQLSAQAHIKAGHTERAIQRYEQLLSLLPNASQPRLELAGLYLKQGEVVKARTQVQNVLDRSPASLAANVMMANVLTESGQIEKAIELYEQLDPKRNPQLVVPLASLYRQAGQPDKARELLESRFEEAPTDLAVLQELFRRGPTRAEAEAYLEKAKTAGLDPSVAAQLERAINPDDQAAGPPNIQTADASNNPLDQALARFRKHFQEGRHEEAQQALAEAAALNPDHAVVVDGQFQYALRNRNWDAAEDAAKHAARLNLDSAGGRFYQGRLLLAKQNYQAAQQTLGEAVNMVDDDPKGWLWLGESQRQAGQYKQAISSFHKALALSPNDVPTMAVLAAAYHSDKQHDRALELFRKLAAAKPNDETYLEQYLRYEQSFGQPQQALSIRQRRANAEPKDIENRRQLAMLHSRMKQHDQAKQVINAVLEDDGRTRNNLLVAAEVHRIAGDIDTTRNLLQENIENLGDDATVDDWLTLARYLRAAAGNDANALRSALTVYRKAQQVEGDDKAATREIADLLFRLRVNEEAATLYGRLDQQQLLSADQQLRYAEVLNRVGKRDEARQVLAGLPADAAGQPEAHILRGVVAMGDQHFEEAVTHFDRAIAQEPNNLAAHVHRARALYATPGRESEARKATTRALEIDPSNVIARQLSAELYRKTDNLPAAIREYERIAEELPNSKQVLLALADLHQRAGDEAALREVLTEGAARFPDEQVFHASLAQMELASGNDREQAIEHLQQVVRSNPAAQNIATLAVQLLMADRPGDAIAMLDQHNDVVSQTPELLAVRGRALAAVDREEEAADAFAKALELCEQFPAFATVVDQMAVAVGLERSQQRLAELASTDAAKAPWANLSLAQIQLGAGKSGESLELLRMIDPEIASGTPARTVFNRLLAFAYNNTGEYDRARIALENMLADDPGNTWASNFLGRLLVERLDQPGKAVVVAEQALEREPKDWRLLDLKGWALLKSGQPDAAVESLRKSLAIKQSSTGSLHMAQAYDAKRDVVNAKMMYNQARQLAELEKNEQIKAEAAAALQRLR